MSFVLILAGIGWIVGAIALAFRPRMWAAVLFSVSFFALSLFGDGGPFDPYSLWPAFLVGAIAFAVTGGAVALLKVIPKPKNRAEKEIDDELARMRAPQEKRMQDQSKSHTLGQGSGRIEADEMESTSPDVSGPQHESNHATARSIAEAHSARASGNRKGTEMNPLKWEDRAKATLSASALLGLIGALIIGYLMTGRGYQFGEWLFGDGYDWPAGVWILLGALAGSLTYFIIHINRPGAWRFIPPPPHSAVQAELLSKALGRPTTDGDLWAFEAAYRTCYIAFAISDPSFKSLPQFDRVKLAAQRAARRYADRIREELHEYQKSSASS